MRTSPRISQSVTICGIRLRFRAFGPWPYLGLSGDQDGERVDVAVSAPVSRAQRGRRSR